MLTPGCQEPVVIQRVRGHTKGKPIEKNGMIHAT